MNYCTISCKSPVHVLSPYQLKTTDKAGQSHVVVEFT